MVGGGKFTVPNPTPGQGVKLLQIDSDTRPGIMIGDTGLLEFWISPDDLAAGRFEAAELHGSSG